MSHTLLDTTRYRPTVEAGARGVLDLDAYLARIGHTGGRAPTLDTLRAIHRRHVVAIAFENLDPLIGRTPSLDVDALQAKLVRGGRGGWCYEHNLLLRHALTALGYRTTGLAARVLWNAPADAPARPRSHMLLLVHLDDADGGPHVADVGFGGMTLTAPLRLDPDVAQATPHGTFRLGRAGDEELTLEVRRDDVWAPLYRFGLHAQEPVDYEVMNWYLANHPQSHFLTTLMVARPLPDGRRLALRDGVLTMHHIDGRTERRVLDDAGVLRATLVEAFGLMLPDDGALEPTLDWLATRSATEAPR